VNSSNARVFARIWADATPLAQYVEEVAQRLCSEPVPGLEPPTRPADPKLSGLASVAMMSHIHAVLSVARRKAPTATRNDLIAGRILAVGRPPDSEQFEKIDPSFWIGSDIDWSGAVSRGDRKVIEVRVVVKADDVALIQSKLRKVRAGPHKAERVGAGSANKEREQPRTRKRVPSGARSVRRREGRSKIRPRRAEKRPHKKVGGRPNTNEPTATATKDLWKTRPEFRELPMKRKVAEVRAAILGEEYRDREPRGYKSSSMENVIGRVINELRNQTKPIKPTKPSKP
jgi:hypothetical protein